MMRDLLSKLSTRKTKLSQQELKVKRLKQQYLAAEKLKNAFAKQCGEYQDQVILCIVSPLFHTKYSRKGSHVYLN